jgi:hypothetical protein
MPASRQRLPSRSTAHALQVIKGNDTAQLCGADVGRCVRALREGRPTGCKCYECICKQMRMDGIKTRIKTA